MLLQLPSLPQVPGPHGVIQASGPQLGPVIRDVYTARPVCVALELPADKHSSQTNPCAMVQLSSNQRTCRSFGGSRTISNTS